VGVRGLSKKIANLGTFGTLGRVLLFRTIMRERNMLLLTFMVFRTRFFRDVVSCNLNLIQNNIQAAKSYFAREVPRLDSRREYVISISEGSL
jgi:hypothetical protein